VTAKTVSDTKTIAIIGGGIGGLFAALSLLRDGFDVHVYEQVKTPREVGAGIVLTPNASRLLRRLGFGAELDRTAVAPSAWRQRRWQDGSTLLLSPLTQYVGPDGEHLFYTAHRADVLAMLLAQIPPERIHLGHRLTALEQRDSVVDLTFENGTRVTADAVIGADGIHSAVRRAVLGAQAPEFTGCVAYRGLVPAQRLAHLDLPEETQLWMGPGKHFVHYFVRGGLVNFVCLIDRDAWTEESWTQPGDPADVRAAYAGWHPQVRGILEAMDETFVWGLFDREPLPRWTFDNVTLLGDACHPMLPFLAQGAAQAIEDSAALAACVEKFGASKLPDAFQYYEAVRLPRTARIQLVARGNKTRNHLPDGPEQRERDARMASGDAAWAIGASAWVYDHDAAHIELSNTGLPPE
jgi:salicylate hydroxylase